MLEEARGNNNNNNNNKGKIRVHPIRDHKVPEVE